MNLALDHVGILGSDVDDLVTTFRKLGFTVIGPATLATGNTDHGVQRSAHIMFRDSYIELTSVKDATPEHHLFPWLSYPMGLRLLLLACENADEAREMVSRSGLNPTPVSPASRALNYGAGDSARFRWFGLAQPVIEEILVGWVEHRDRDRVFHKSVQNHKNTAQSIDAILSGCALPGALASNAAPVAWRNLRHGSVMQGLVLRVADGASVINELASQGIPYDLVQGGVQVSPNQAAGVQLLFREGP